MIGKLWGLVASLLVIVALAACSPLEGDGRHLVPLSGAPNRGWP